MLNITSLEFYTNKARFLLDNLRDKDISKDKALKNARLLKNRLQSMEKCVDDLIEELEKCPISYKGENHE